MVLKGVKAVFAKDKKTVTTYAYPSKAGYTYKLTKKTWKNVCPFCGGTHQQIIKQIQNNVKTYSIICDVTEGGCGASVGYSEEPLDVILAWNERYGHIYGNIKLLE